MSTPVSTPRLCWPSAPKIFSLIFRSETGERTIIRKRLPQSSQKILEARLSKKLMESGIPIINSVDEQDILPGSFRMSGSLFLPSSDINKEGLDTLHISGSSQPSQLGFKALKRCIHRHITIVNLKQEDGGFVVPRKGVGAIAFSYLMSMPWWVQDKRTVEEIDISEQQRIEKINSKSKFTIYGITDKNNLREEAHSIDYKITVNPQYAMTEKQLVDAEGFAYFRIPDKKFGNMAYEHVDSFVDFVKKLPREEHVHFHCKRGQSRTTLFMTMYDMMRNADRVSADDIIKRQGPQGIGGVDLTQIPEKSSWEHSFKKGWLEFLYQFHQYARENKGSDFQKPWSQWAHEQALSVQEEVLLDHYRGASIESNLPDMEDVANMHAEPLVLVTLNEGKLPVQNFRTTQDLWLEEPSFNQEGLKDVYASGSSQYTKVDLELLIKKIQPHASRLVICDLRSDDHLFVNGMNVCSFQPKGSPLLERTPEAIKSAELRLKQRIKGEVGIKIRAVDSQYLSDEVEKRLSLRIYPNEVQTPEELVRSMGAKYLLIGNKQPSGFADEDIDRLITYLQTIPENTWIHFHCKKGKGRTTLFMTMYDMLHNAGKVSMKEIVERQHRIGGSNLFDITPKNVLGADEKEFKKQRIVFLARFQEYAKEYILSKARQELPLSWTDWSSQHTDFQPNIDNLVVDSFVSVRR
jgi:predicted protein tyrosine phosphatase